MIFCNPGSLVGAQGWLPTEPFDYNWSDFGCNQLVCGSCKQKVRSHVLPDGVGRHYECACQQHDAYSYHLLGSDQGQIHEFLTEWRCNGHPELRLPAVLDGIAISTASDFKAIVDKTLVSSPFVAPSVNSPSFWVQRLYRLLSDESLRRGVGEAVVAQLSSTDPQRISVALEFFSKIPAANGAEQIASVVDRERMRLLSTPDPLSANYTLYEWALEVLETVFATTKSQTVRAMMHRALIAGEAGSGMVATVASEDPDWFCNHASDIVRAHREHLNLVLEALRGRSAADCTRALRNLQQIDQETKAAVLEFARTLSETDREIVLRELA